MRVKKFFLIFIMCLLLTGCWDNIEIDRRAFVSTIAVDIGADIKKLDELKNIDSKEAFSERPLSIIEVTYGFPDIRNLNPQKGTAEEIAITTSGYSMTDTYFKAIAQSSRALHFGHTKLLVLSDRLFDYPEVLKEVFDYIERDAILNRSMMIIVVKDVAKDYVDYKPTMEENLESYISGIMSNNSKYGAIIPVTLHNYLEDVKKQDSMLPYIVLEEEKNPEQEQKNKSKEKINMISENKKTNEEEELKAKQDLALSGMAVIKNFKIIGYVNDVEIQDIQIIRGKLGSGKKVVYKYGRPIDYYIDENTSKVKIDYKNGKLFVNYNITNEGSIKGYYKGAKLLNEKNIKEIQEDLNVAMKKELEKVVKNLQRDIKSDSLEIREYIKKYKPNLWEEIKDKWNIIYENAEITVNVNNKIMNVGVVD
ncbi:MULTISPECIES: Ger(x)C family spore germination protein [Clostridium]|uniref:Ger(X)C family spore germination protein n=1 Tax=Clostridium faecium TaxID=2762223 RepID=A0ABR8YSJ2_9CLOT|nr:MULTISPECIES: Ger(x)C family spore germination protein [Clostridium]MBD8047112.1 Ger(x)C family spore germination protein [Clostridium faecium]MDU1349614.1 Ger(x)C family spore germination protein [Clostridium argentinense]